MGRGLLFYCTHCHSIPDNGRQFKLCVCVADVNGVQNFIATDDRTLLRFVLRKVAIKVSCRTELALP